MKQADKWVLQYQQATSQSDQEACQYCYSKIHQLGQPTIQKLSIRFRFQLGSEFEDEAITKFQDLLPKFQPDQNSNFIGFLHKALFRLGLKLIRQRTQREKAGQWLTYQSATSAQADLRNEACQARLKRYSIRKRKLLDSIQTVKDSEMAVILLDQRRRMAEKIATLIAEQWDQPPSSWIDQIEIWYLRDHQRFPNRHESVDNGKIWEHFGQQLDRQPACYQNKDLLNAWQIAGGIPPNSVAWRRRVSRALTTVKDQLDLEELKFFHIVGGGHG